MTPLEAMQATLAGEHAAFYVYGVLGGQVSRSAQPTLADLIGSSYAVHRQRRDRLTALIDADGATPVASAPSYQLPNPAATARQLRTAGRIVETRCLALYGQLVENSSGAVRAWAITTLDTAAVQELGYGATPVDLPGSAG